MISSPKKALANTSGSTSSGIVVEDGNTVSKKNCTSTTRVLFYGKMFDVMSCLANMKCAHNMAIVY